MNKDFIPYEQALELKEIEFNETCLGWFKNNELTTSFNDLYTNPKERGKRFEIIKAPTFSQAFRWFREKHKLTHSIRTFFNEEFYYEIYVSFNYEITSDKHNTYEEAELACLKELIEIIKNKFGGLEK
jgi:hypothetical protein